MTLKACVTSISLFLPSQGVDQPVAGWGVKPLGLDETCSREGVSPNDKCRKPQSVERDFKEGNEKRERWWTEADITCQSKQQVEDIYIFWGGFILKPNALKLKQGDTCMLKSTYKHISQSHLLKLVGLCLWCIIKKIVARCWCDATARLVLWLIRMILAPGGV